MVDGEEEDGIYLIKLKLGEKSTKESYLNIFYRFFSANPNIASKLTSQS